MGQPNRSCLLPPGYNASRVHLHFSGFSETRNMIHTALNVQACGGELSRHLRDAGFSHKSRGKDSCQRRQEWTINSNTSFLGMCREGLGLHSSDCCHAIDGHYSFCCTPGASTGKLSVSFTWKHALPPRDADKHVAKMLREQHAAGMRVVAVYSVLPFSSLDGDGYNANHQPAHNFSDAWTPPQAFFGPMAAGCPYTLPLATGPGGTARMCNLEGKSHWGPQRIRADRAWRAALAPSKRTWWHARLVQPCYIFLCERTRA